MADLALHGTLLVGPPQSIPCLDPGFAQSLESFSFSVSLSCNAQTREVGKGSNVLGSPLVALAHLIAVLAKQPPYMPLLANELVTTGTITTAHSMHPGETWRAEFQGISLPCLSVEFPA